MSRSLFQHRISVSALRKNNEQLAKNLNTCKMTIGELKAELVEKERKMQDLQTEVASLRVGVDPGALQAEVSRQVSAIVDPIHACLTGAVDCLVQTSDHVTKGLSLASLPRRASS